MALLKDNIFMHFKNETTFGELLNAQKKSKRFQITL